MSLKLRKLDLHVHTPASHDFADKAVTADQIVAHAQGIGLDAIAVTDHNTVDFIDQINTAAKAKGFTIFPGFEISCGGTKNGSIHVIGLFDPAKSKDDLQKVLGKLDAVAKAVERANNATPAERLVETRERVGQDLFRAALMAYWKQSCAITGIREPTMLRASHAKPWAVAEDHERLDVHNGLLLAVHLDVAFDKGFIAVADDGEVLVSAALPRREREVLGVDAPRRVVDLRPAHIPYLRWHRDRIWQKPSATPT